MDESDRIQEEQPQHSDDFQQIKGIGKLIAQALNELGINDYAELTHFTPEKLSELLKPKVAFISAQRIERDNWLDQVRALVEERQAQTNEQPGESKPATPEAGEIRDESIQKTIPERRPGSWREVADFFVSFGYTINSEGNEQLQTKVHHSQADQLHQWDGIAVDELIHWMLNRANLPEPRETEEEGRVEALPPAEESKVGLEDESAYLVLSNLWVSHMKMPVMAQNNQSQTGLIRVEGNLRVAGQDAYKLSYDRIPFVIEMYLVNLQTKQSEIVANYSDQLVPEELSYAIHQDFPIPNAGRYQLFVLARLLPPGAIATHLQGPVIRIER